MTIPWQNLIGAAFALSILGWLLVGATMALIRWCVFGDSKPVKDSFGWLDFWLGTIERVVAATMFVLHVSSLPGFYRRVDSIQARRKLAAHQIRVRPRQERHADSAHRKRSFVRVRYRCRLLPQPGGAERVHDEIALDRYFGSFGRGGEI